MLRGIDRCRDFTGAHGKTVLVVTSTNRAPLAYTRCFPPRINILVAAVPNNLRRILATQVIRYAGYLVIRSKNFLLLYRLNFTSLRRVHEFAHQV